ncbi:hypothetical protein IV203_014987 [Nitzschia inconspicua]|uniref:SET domain-containing protein n=1 Tax=Nitzschia inconspicua TaxID=303405 RepID=A0A9K3L9Q6_9STRA|nr:hypothetical protein IV203_014987 [Nitzschia inconspicua]
MTSSKGDKAKVKANTDNVATPKSTQQQQQQETVKAPVDTANKTKNKPNGTTNKRPKKATHFGKANPVRDSILFLGFLTVMFAVSYLTKNVGIPNEDDGTPKLPSLSDIRQIKRVLEHTLQETQKSGFDPDTDCSVMLGPSSLTNAGWGLFSGKNFGVGDDILPSIHIMIYGRVQSIPVNEENKHPYALLIQPHNILHNAKWELDIANNSSGSTTGNILPKLVATKIIAPGDELFVAWDDHLYRYYPHMFPNLPTSSHFERADSIIQEAKEVFKVTGGSVRRARIPEITKGLKMVKRALFRYDGTVARLLPSTVDDLLLYQNKTSTSELITVKKMPLQSLISVSRCLTNLEWRRAEPKGGDSEEANATSSAEKDSSYRQILSKDYVEKGDLIIPVPILLHPMENGNTNESSDAEEEEEEEQAARVCRNSAISSNYDKGVMPRYLSPYCLSLKNTHGAALGIGLCPLIGIVKMTTNAHKANAKFQWSTKSDQHRKLLAELLHSSPPTEIIFSDAQIQSNMLAMSWDVVALRDINQNETVVVWTGDLDDDLISQVTGLASVDDESAEK